MKTPRDVLLNRHASVEPQLDALRHRTLATLPPCASRVVYRPNRITALWRALAPWTGTRQAVGLLAAWTVIALLNVEKAQPRSNGPIVRDGASTPRSFLAHLQEHRRQIRDHLSLDSELPSPTAPRPPSLLWHRRPNAEANTA